MKKKILIAVIMLAIIGAITAYYMTSGQYESKLVKSAIANVNADTDKSEWTNTLKELQGSYAVQSGENQAAEILFHVEGLKKTIGAFEAFSIQFNKDSDLTTASIDVDIQASSINTGNSMRDESMADPEFFHFEKYPTITYHAQSIIPSDTGYVAKGELTLMGETKALDLPFKHLGGGENDNGEQFEAFEGKVVFDRTAYGMEEVSGTGNIVTLNFYAELIKQ